VTNAGHTNVTCGVPKKFFSAVAYEPVMHPCATGTQDDSSWREEASTMDRGSSQSCRRYLRWYGQLPDARSVMVFGVPAADGCIGASSIQSGEESGGIGDVKGCELFASAPERPGILAAGVVCPKEADFSLFGSPHCAIDKS